MCVCVCVLLFKKFYTEILNLFLMSQNFPIDLID